MDRGRQTVKFYGLVYFQCKDGYLAASGLDGERLYLRTPPIVGDTADEALPFFGFADACVFRVVPTLSSRAATSSVKGASGAAPPASASSDVASYRGSAADGSDGSTASALGSLGGMNYDPRKTADIIDVEEITYGKSFSLVHEASGLFVSVAHALPSDNDPDCLSVVLVKPSAAMSPACELSLVSRYKIHADGDKLCRADSVLIRLSASPMFLHVSSSPIMERGGGGSGGGGGGAHCNDGDVELLHRTFRFGGSLTYAAKNRLQGRAGGVGGAVAAAAAAAQGTTLSLQGSFAMPPEHAVAAPECCSTEVAAEALTLEYLDEVNACEEGGVSFTLQRYDVGTDRANRQRTQLRITRPYVACGVPVALYHRERESFLMTSATQVAASTRMEEEREYDRSTSTSPGAEALGSAPRSTGTTAAASAAGGASLLGAARRQLPADGCGEMDAEDGIAVPSLKSRQRRSTLGGVTALRGAEAAIRTTATATPASRRNSPGAALANQPSVSFAEGHLAGSFTAAMFVAEQQLRERAERTEGLIDTGRGRCFPFPVFTATAAEDTSAAEDMSLLDANHNCNTLWSFEHEEPTLGGPLRYGSSWRYRVRHVASGMYLAVCGSAVDAMLEQYDDEDRASAKEGGVVPGRSAPATRTASSTVSTAEGSDSSSSSGSSSDDEGDEGKSKDEAKADAQQRCHRHRHGARRRSPRLSLSSAASRSDQSATSTVNAGTGAAGAEHATAATLTRETTLCLLPPPRTRKEREATLFCVEPMYATDSVYLIEQTCLSIKSVLTEMYVVTDSSVDGSDVALTLDWQPSSADPIIVSYVPNELQLDTRFIASQCVWLARYRAEMQALVLERQRERAATEAAARRGDEEARQKLAEEEAYLQSLPELIQPYFNTPDADKALLKQHRGYGGPVGAAASRNWSDGLSATYTAAALANNWSMAGHRSFAGGSVRGSLSADPASTFSGSTSVAAGGRPVYASMHNTIRLCQRALVALIQFCSESDETNVLQREGLPIRSRQALFYEMRFHRLLFDVVMAPFQLLHSADPAVYGTYSSVVNSIAAVMKPDHGSFDEIYETLRMAEQQQEDLSCVWSGLWHSSAGHVSGVTCGSAAQPASGLRAGLLDEQELMLPVHRELHLLTRLALRLLREIIRDNAAAFSTGWSAHIPRLLRLDGLRLHVVDTMQALFTDNPFIPLRAVQQVSEHFICVSQQLRRGAYMDFLGAACTIKYKGVAERQAFVCQKLLVENPQSLCRFIVVVPSSGRAGAAGGGARRNTSTSSSSEGTVYVLPNSDPDAATDSERDDYSRVSARNHQHSEATCLGGGPAMQHRDTTGPFPPPSSSSSSGSESPPQSCSAEEGEARYMNASGIYTAPPPGFVAFTDFFSNATSKRQTTFVANQIALFARLCYDGCPAQCREVVGRLFPPAAMKALLRDFVWTGEQVVGHGCLHDKLRSFLIRLAMQCFVLPRMSAPSVQLRVSTVLFGSSQLRQHQCDSYSGLPDDEMTALLKAAVLQLFRANSFFVQDDVGRSLLMRSAVSIWLKLTRFRQYTHEEVLTVLPMLTQLLDGTRDVLDINAVHRATAPAPAMSANARRRPTGKSAKVASPPARAAPSRPAPAQPARAGAASSGTLRLVHKVESVHLMRIREMICQALFLALQHEVFRAADDVIVRLYKAYTQVKEPHADTRASTAFAAALSAAVQMPAVAVHELGNRVSSLAGLQEGGAGARVASERSPLLPPYGADSIDAQPSLVSYNSLTMPLQQTASIATIGRGGGGGGGEGKEEAAAAAGAASLAAKRRADGYHELTDGPQASLTGVAGGSMFGSGAQASSVYSEAWTAQFLHASASSAFAALSSSSSDSDGDDEGGDGMGGNAGGRVSGSLSGASGSGCGGSGVGMHSVRQGKRKGGVFSRLSAAVAPASASPRSGVSAAEVQALLDYHTSCIVECFQPQRLVPFLFDVARYDCRPLTVQAMALLVQLSVVKRSIAQLVLKVNTLPSFEVLRSFDRMYDVAVRLREAYETVVPGGSRAAQWEPAIQFALAALDGPAGSPPPPAASAPSETAATKATETTDAAEESGQHTEPHHHASAKRIANFRRMYESFQCQSAEDLANSDSEAESGEDSEGDGHQSDDAAQQRAKTAAAEEASLSMSMRATRKKQRIAALWSKTSGAVRMLVYNNTIRNRRRALGLSETSTIPVNVIIRAEMMAHWKIHESLLQMLPYLTSADAAFKSVLQFFYFFSFSESNSLLLQPYVELFIDKLDPAHTSATVCLHIIVRVLRSKPQVEEYLSPELLEALATHINDELYTKLPDSELVEMLSRYIFSKSSVSPVVRRRMMILFREHGTLLNLARFRLNPTPVEVVFTSALVNLVCSICGSHTSVLTLARSMLPAENLCSVILQRRIVETLPTALVDVSRGAKLASRAADTSATPTAVAALKLLNPYVRILVALYFVPKNDSQGDSRRRCLQWMGNPQLWSIVRLFTAAMNAVSNAIEEDGETRVVNRGLSGVKVYRTLLCSTTPLAMAAFLINCFSNEGYAKYNKEVIKSSFMDLAAAAERFGALLLRHAAEISFTVEEAVNFRRFIGALYHRLSELGVPTSTQLEALTQRCDETRQRMRVWLSAQQQALEASLADRAGGNGGGYAHDASPSSPFNSAASFAASFAGLRKSDVSPAAASTGAAAASAAALLSTLRRRQASADDDVSAFHLLFAEEAVSQAQLQSQEVLEAAGLSSGVEHLSAAASGGGGGLASAAAAMALGKEPEGADAGGLNSVGLLLPGVLASSRGVSAVRASLRATLRGDTIIPSLRRGPSEVAMIAVQHLLRSAHDDAMRGSIVCVLEAMRDHLFRPRTFVGVMNLFSNALDAALHYPNLVHALSGGVASAAVGDSAVPPPQSTGAPTRGLPAEAVRSTEGLGYALQNTFNDSGMLNVVVSLCGLEEDVISLNAIRLGVLILEGGNRHAQSRLLDYFLTREEGFFHNVRDILHRNLIWVEQINAEHQYYLMKRGMRSEETKSALASANIQIINALTPHQGGSGLGAAANNVEVFSASKSYVEALQGDRQRWLTTLSSAAQVSGWARVRGSRRLKLITFLFRLLQLFCEGHFAGLQNYVRAQHDNLHSANVIIETMAFMEEMATFVTPSNYRVLSQGFELLTEVCQGPCRLNQEALIDYGVCRVIRHIVDCLQSQSGGDRGRLSALLSQVGGPARSSPALSAATERDSAGLEKDAMNRLGVEEAAQLRVSLSNTLLAVLEGCREGEAYRRVLRQIPLTSVAMEVQHALDPATLHLLEHDEDHFEGDDRMEAMFNWLIFLKSVQPYAELEGVSAGVETLLRSSDAVSKYLGSIEVRRADGLERVYFRIPIICFSLTQERKDELLWGVDRTSRATKLADFLHQSDEIIFAVEWNHAFHKRIERWTRFAIPYYDGAAGQRPGVLRRGVRSLKLLYNTWIAAKLFPYELASYDMVSMVIAVLSNTVLVAMEGGQSSRRSAMKLYSDWTVSVLCILQVVICGFMCIVYLTVLFPIHLYGAYKTKQRFAAGKARLNVELTEVYANLTAGERWRSFFSWFDMQFRITLLFFALLSCTVSHYFAAFNLMLVVYSIPTLRTFISAITMNGKQLLLTSFMGVIMLYLFSIVGFLVFSNQYNPDGDDNGGDGKAAVAHTNCETLLQCFAYILDQGLRAGGGVGDVMVGWAWGNERMLARLAYDMLFYALVTVVFLNILFGIIIDTFGQMRDEKREKETDMHGFCFICGLDADSLEKGSVMGFTKHVKEEHNMWMYLYFMHHLRRKDPSEYTGQESYVNACIKRGGLNFFPEDSCVALVEQQEKEASERANAIGDEDEEEDAGGGESGSAGEAVDAAARAAMKELTVARETIGAHLKEWQSDSMRLKALLQQLELTSRSVAMEGGIASRRSYGRGGGGGGGAVSVQSGQTLPRSAKAETVGPHDDAAAMQLPTPLSYSGGDGVGGTAGGNNRSSLRGVEGVPVPGSDGGGLRAMQAQLQTEKEQRQRLELERQAMQQQLKAKEAELRQLRRQVKAKGATEQS